MQTLTSGIRILCALAKNLSYLNGYLHDSGHKRDNSRASKTSSKALKVSFEDLDDGDDWKDIYKHLRDSHPNDHYEKRLSNVSSFSANPRDLDPPVHCGERLLWPT